MKNCLKVIVGQQTMIDRLLIGLLSNGHVLLEGVPGLANTFVEDAGTGRTCVISAAFSSCPTCFRPTSIGTMIYDQA